MLAYQIAYMSNLLPVPGGIGVLDGRIVGALVLYGVGAAGDRGHRRLPRDRVLDPGGVGDDRVPGAPPHPAAAARAPAAAPGAAERSR